jgi:hypothetical protein
MFSITYLKVLGYYSTMLCSANESYLSECTNPICLNENNARATFDVVRARGSAGGEGVGQITPTTVLPLEQFRAITPKLTFKTLRDNPSGISGGVIDASSL